MGRRFPVDENQEFHPMMSLPIMIACILATMAVVSSLCGQRKKDDSEKKKNLESSEVENPPNEFDMPAGDGDDSSNPGEERLPPPPGVHSRAASYHIRSSSTASHGKLKSSMSMKISGGLKSSMSMKVSGNTAKENNPPKEKKEKKLKHEDSIWQKTIILGEKCKVPDEEDMDAILYDDKGNRISAYHKRAPTGTALSRQASSMDPDPVITNKDSESKRELDKK